MIKKNAFLLSVIVLISLLFGLKAQASTFDYTIICDNCKSPSYVAKSRIPQYPHHLFDEDEESEDTWEHDREYSVLVVDAVQNKYYHYEIEVYYSGTQVSQLNLYGSSGRIANNITKYYHTKHLMISHFNRPPHTSAKSVSGLDCSNPGVVYNNRVCQSFYFSDIEQRVLNEKVTSWTTFFSNIEGEVKVERGDFSASARYKKDINTVYYHQKDGAIIAIKLNKSGTGYIGIDTDESVFKTGATLSGYLQQEELKNAWGEDLENYLDSHGCDVVGGTIYATYRYTARPDPKGGILIDTHTTIVREPIELECD